MCTFFLRVTERMSEKVGAGDTGLLTQLPK